MSITYEEAISTLKVMFPDWEEETLSTVLVSNQYHVERTIENILSMCGDADASSTSPAPPSSQTPQRSETSSYGAMPVPVSHALAPAPAPAPSSQRRPAAAAAPAPTKQYRGINCTLPEDFLRPPGFQNRVFADEELAIMLQNELFQREVRAMFGDEFVRQAAGGNTTQQAGRPTPSRQSSTAVGRSNGAGSASVSSNPGEPTAAGDGDLGIIKTLSSMGGAARRNLSMLAARFSSSQQQTRHGETGTAREFKPLVDGNGDDDEEVEFVSFDNNGQNRSRHVLQDTGETTDSENPLIHRNYGDTSSRDL